jgi:hypothetical protein
MKKYIAVLILGCVAILFIGVGACNYDVGECYVRGEEGDGVGGSILPTGVGGYGDAPPREPQNAGDSWNPCSALAECTITWKAGSDVCNEKGTTSSCTTLYQGHHTSLDEAKEQCEKVYGLAAGAGAQSCDSCKWATTAKDPVEECKKMCDKINLDCIARCPKGDKGCMHNCNVQNGKCQKDCEK